MEKEGNEKCVKQTMDKHMKNDENWKYRKDGTTSYMMLYGKKKKNKQRALEELVENG